MASFQNIVYQMILSVLRDSKMESASPGKINRFIGLEAGVSASIGTDDEIREAILEIIGEEFELTDGEKEGLDKKLRDSEKIDPFLKSTKLGMDPFAMLQTYAKRLVPILVPLLIAAGIGEVILETSLAPGGIIDRRLRRVITEEVNGLLDKQTQKNFHIGIRQLTIQSRAGFRNIQGIGSEDNLRQIRMGFGNGLRKSALDYIDFSKGVRDLRE